MTKQENSEKVKLSSVKSKQIREAELAQKIFKKLNTQKPENDVNLGQESQEIIKLQKEIAQLKEENFNIKTISTLERAGCLKPELVLNSVPKDCEDIDKWVENFKSENDILFLSPDISHGGGYKPTITKNLSPNEIMNNFIRGIQ